MPLQYVRVGASLVAHYIPSPMYDYAALRRWNHEFERLEDESCSDQSTAAKWPDDFVEDVLQSKADGIAQLEGDASGRCSRAIEFLMAARQIDAKAVKRAHAMLMGHERMAFRSTVVWVGAARAADAIFVPPPPDRVQRLVDQALSVGTRSDISVLLRAVAMFVRILHVHPYQDGNGKLARLLGLAMLKRNNRPVSALCRLYRNIEVARGHEWLHENHTMTQSEDWNGLLSYVIGRIQGNHPIGS